MATIKNFPNNVDENIGASAVMKWLHGRTSGVFGANNNLSVAAVLNSMAVTVSDGIGWLTNSNGDGTAFWNDTEETQSAKLELSIALADAVLPRIDRVVVSWDTLDYTTKPEIIILKGTAADTPLPPALTNTALKRQLSLAQIRVPAGTSKITSDLITDERLNADVCGLVTESVSVDTTEVQAQFDALLTLVRTELEELNAGTEAMLKTTYDPQRKAQDVFAYADSVGTQIYTQTKTGTAHALAGSGANGRMLVTAAYAAGDTFTVNGTVVSTVTGADSALTEDNLGTWVSFIYDGTQLNFKQGGLSSADKALLIPANIREKITIAKVTGTLKTEAYTPTIAVYLYGIGNWKVGANFFNNPYFSIVNFDSNGQGMNFRCIKAGRFTFQMCSSCGQATASFSCGGATLSLKGTEDEQVARVGKTIEVDLAVGTTGYVRTNGNGQTHIYITPILIQ